MTAHSHSSTDVLAQMYVLPLCPQGSQWPSSMVGHERLKIQELMTENAGM